MSDMQKYVELASAIVDAANVSFAEPHWEVADVGIAVRLQAPPGRCLCVASLGNVSWCCDSLEESLTCLLDKIKRTASRRPTRVA